MWRADFFPFQNPIGRPCYETGGLETSIETSLPLFSGCKQGWRFSILGVSKTTVFETDGYLSQRSHRGEWGLICDLFQLPLSVTDLADGRSTHSQCDLLSRSERYRLAGAALQFPSVHYFLR